MITMMHSNIDQDAAVMRLEGRLGPKLDSNPVPLEPFGHQVAGQASMLSVDPTTVCKPLIPREHHLYRTLPPQLIPFTPQYRGVLYVRLEEEEDGRLILWGYHPDAVDNNGPDPEDAEAITEPPQGEEGREDDRFLQPLQLDWSSGASTPMSSGSELDMISAVDMEQTGLPSRPSSGCVVRVKQDGEYEVKAGGTTDNRFIIPVDEESSPQAGKGSNPTGVLTTQPLNPWGLSLHTRLLDKMRKSRSSSSGCPFLVLENVVARFTRPCILDLKVGSRLHGDGASQKKIASQSRKCNITTSRTLGLRLCGMQVYQETTGAYKSLDKYFGRTLTDDTFCDVLREFLHNGREMRSELLAAIVSRLTALLTCLKGLSSFRFYASSLLIIYDGCSPSPRFSEQNTGGERNSAGSARRDSSGEREESKNQSGRMFPGSPEHPAAVKSEQFVVVPSERVGPEMLSGSMGATPLCSRHLSLSTSTLTDSTTRCSLAASCQSSNNGNVVSESLDLVDVRMIDFAHTTHSGFHEDEVVHEGPDDDYMWGLQNLIDLFSQLQGEKT